MDTCTHSNPLANESNENGLINMTAVWQGKRYPLQLPSTTTVGELKQQLEQMTQVLASRQKLLGLIKKKLPNDDATLLSLNIPSNSLVFTMMGSVESQIIKDPTDVDLPDVLNDMDVDYCNDILTIKPHKDPVNIQSLNKVIEKASIRIINEPRKAKKLLVLDLDYTLFDCKTPASHIDQLSRPGLHEFLATVYVYYDICIWSQTSWKWLEMKITELGMLNHSEYHISFVLDQSTMFSIMGTEKQLASSSSKSVTIPKRHQVKPLQFIWSKFPGQYNAFNTIHIDDLSRNFAMNPQSGLKITAFKNGPTMRATDRELILLGRYLVQLSMVDDFRSLDHKKWKQFNGPLPQ